ncbi:hypothetical protein DPQ22_05215 [Candidatus Tokpelaia sp.]|nr:hypothetical protein DPQ22_05215 [Candidatus Tokpelaia sp.]
MNIAKKPDKTGGFALPDNSRYCRPAVSPAGCPKSGSAFIAGSGQVPGCVLCKTVSAGGLAFAFFEAAAGFGLAGQSGAAPGRCEKGSRRFYCFPNFIF